MTRAEVIESIKKVIHDCLPDRDFGELTEESVINTDTAIDSMGFTLVICRLEGMYDVRIPEREWMSLSTLGDVADAILRELEGK